MRLRFSKYHGAGNDFVIIDDRRREFRSDDFGLIRQLCDRHFGIGADGLMLLRESEAYDFRMLYYNSDGKPGTMCGNGGRCMIAFGRDIGLLHGEGPFRFDAPDGAHEGYFYKNGSIRIRMRDVDNIRSMGDGYRIDTGSIHHVEYVDKLVDTDVVARGRRIRYDPAYAADHGCNVNFIEAREDGSIAIRTYERGVEDETLACGTGSVAAAIASHTGGLHRDAYTVHARGGDLNVYFVFRDGAYRDVYLEGPAKHVFDGETEL